LRAKIYYEYWAGLRHVSSLLADWFGKVWRIKLISIHLMRLVAQLARVALSEEAANKLRRLPGANRLHYCLATLTLLVLLAQLLSVKDLPQDCQ
jgi:hypothetical protein